MKELIDFSNCQESNRVYNKGVMKKFGVMYDGLPYMLKQQEKKDTHYIELGYSATYISSIYSEYIACEIAKNLGLDCQETKLGFIIDNDKKINVVACMDFLDKNETIIDFYNIAHHLNKNREEKLSLKTLSGTLEIIENQNEINKEELKEYFWNMFVFDGYIGNFDRNPTNWGIIKNLKTKEKRLCPIFDNGSCLHPKTPLKVIEKYHRELKYGKTLEDRAMFNLTSGFQNEKAKRLRYFDYFQQSNNLDFLKAIIRMSSKFEKHHKNNLKIIEDLKGLIPLERVEVLTHELDFRYKNMILPTVDRALNQVIDYKSQIDLLLKEIEDNLTMKQKMNTLLNKYRKY